MPKDNMEIVLLFLSTFSLLNSKNGRRGVTIKEAEQHLISKGIELSEEGIKDFVEHAKEYGFLEEKSPNRFDVSKRVSLLLKSLHGVISKVDKAFLN